MELKWTLKVVHVAVGFFFVFAAFNAAQALATTISGNLGNISLATLYAVFTISCLFAPSIVMRLGPKLSMAIGAVPYAGMVFSNLKPSYGLSIPANAAVGLGAPLLWTGSSVFVARCAFASARADAQSSDAATSYLNGVFFSLYQFNGVCGLLASSFILSYGGGNAKEILFLALGTIGAFGVLILLTVRDVDSAGSAKLGALVKRVSVRQTIALNGNAKLALMIPIMLYTGASIGFLFADYTRFGISRVLGASYNGYVLACFFGANTVVTYGYGWVAGTRFGRRGLVVLATCAQGAFYAFFLCWPMPENYVSSGQAGDWHRVREATAGDKAVLFLGAVVFALGDAVWEPQPAAMLQSFFAANDDDVQAAMSNMKRKWTDGMCCVRGARC